MTLLRCHITGPFSRDETLRSPQVDPGPPVVRIAVDQVHREGRRLRFRVLVAYGLPKDYASSFADVEHGHVLVVRDGEGRAFADRLVDPTVVPLVDPGDNFVDRRRDPPSAVFASGRVNVPVELETDGAVLVHVALHDILSNVVRVDGDGS